jgi:hypothetical protein
MDVSHFEPPPSQAIKSKDNDFESESETTDEEMILFVRSEKVPKKK